MLGLGRDEHDVAGAAIVLAAVDHECAGAVEDVEDFGERVRLHIHAEAVVVLRLPHVDAVRR